MEITFFPKSCIAYDPLSLDDRCRMESRFAIIHGLFYGCFYGIVKVTRFKGCIRCQDKTAFADSRFLPGGKRSKSYLRCL